MKSKETTHQLIPVGLGTRWAAMQVDFLVLWVAIGVPLNFIMTPGPMDGVSTLIVLGTMSLYFIVANALFSATIGQRVLGYKIIPAVDQKPHYIVRFILGFVAFLLGAITWLANRDVKDGVYWWDRESNTRAVPLHYIHHN